MIIGTIIIAIILGSILFLVIIKENHTDYIKEYTKRQQNECYLLAQGILQLQENDADTYVQFVKEHYDSTGSNWPFLMEDTTVIYAQSQTTTDELGKWKEKKYFDAYINDLDAIVTTYAFQKNEKDFTIGIITDTTYALNSGGIIKLEIYMIIFYACIVFVTILAILSLATELYKREEYILNQYNELRKRNKQFAEYENIELNKEQTNSVALSDLNSNKFEDLKYDAPVLKALLNKSSDESLYPVCFMYARIIMKNIYYSKADILYMYQFIKEQLSKTQILTEVGRGKYIAILYKTKVEDAIELKQRINDLILKSEDKRLLPLQVTIEEVSNYDDLFETMMKGKKFAFLEVEHEV